jgi:putative membrane protein
MWHGYDAGGGWWMMGLGVLFWGGLGTLAVWAIVRSAGSHRMARGEPRSEDPSESLKRRLARGEIDETEFQSIKKHLQER